MFRVHYIDEAPGGFTNTKIFFDLGTGIEEEKRFFLKRENADHYLNVSKFTYVCHMVFSFVKNSKRLIEMGDRQIYKTKKKTDAMANCLAFTDQIREMSVLDICCRITELEEDLEALIPTGPSPAHDLSYFQVHSLLRFAKKEIGTSANPSSVSE